MGTRGNGNAVGQAALNVATLNGVNVANTTVQANVNIPPGQYAACGPGDQNMYFAALLSTGSGYVAGIWINQAGVWTLVTALVPVVGNGQGTLQFRTIGSSLQLSWKGNLIVSATDTRLSTGSVGIRTSAGVALADFSVS